MSSKEEPRRVVASVYNGDIFDYDNVGFENKTNFFHCEFRALNPQLAYGIYAFISSHIVDAYFRIFNGHTQVNATDLRFLRYPSKEQLLEMGEKVLALEAHDLQILDSIVDEIVFNGKPS